MTNSGIYVIENIQTNKVYIGRSKNLNKRKTEHFRMLRKSVHHNIYLQRSFNKWGRKNFVFRLLEDCQDEYLTDREKFWLDYYYETDWKLCYNISRDSVTSMTGRNHTEETKRKMSRDRTGRMNPFFGRTHKPETREKIRKARKGTKASEETLKILSECRRGEKNHFFGKSLPKKVLQAAVEKTRKPVVMLDKKNKKEIMKFNSISAAANYINGDISFISRVCRDSSKSAYGYKWAFEKGVD